MDKDSKLIWEIVYDAAAGNEYAVAKHNVYAVQDHRRTPPSNRPDAVEWITSYPFNVEWITGEHMSMRLFNAEQLEDFQEKFSGWFLRNMMRAVRVFYKGDRILIKVFKNTSTKEVGRMVVWGEGKPMLNFEEAKPHLDFSQDAKIDINLDRL